MTLSNRSVFNVVVEQLILAGSDAAARSDRIAQRSDEDRT